jgi:hypothetical protein
MNSSREARAFKIRLSGERQGDHYQVWIDARAVDMTASTLSAFVALLLARGREGTGFVALNRVAVHRLRQALDRALGQEAGQAIIETGCGEEYRLTVSREQLRGRLVIDPSFFELEGLGVISAEEAEALRRLGRVL